MRNKEQFLTDYNEVVKTEIQNDETVVEDAAHTLNHSAEPVFIVPAEFTKTNKDEKFVFEQKERKKQTIQMKVCWIGSIKEEVANNDNSIKWWRSWRTAKREQLDGSRSSWKW